MYYSGRSRIFERGFSFSLTKMPAQFELKKKSSTFILLVFYIYYWIISNKTTVIQASQSDCSIRVYEFQKGVSVETLKPPWIRHCIVITYKFIIRLGVTLVSNSGQFTSSYTSQNKNCVKTVILALSLR